MPNKYNTGGVVARPGGAYLPGENAGGLDLMAAGSGTCYRQPNTNMGGQVSGKGTPPGGYGSTGYASKSTPKGGMKG